MEKSRRKFLGISLVLGLVLFVKVNLVVNFINVEKSDKKFKIFILGGMSFLGLY